MSFIRPIRAFAQEQRGNVAVEYAILLGLIIAVVFLGLDVLSRSTDSVFTQVSSALSDDGNAAMASSIAPRAGTIAEQRLESSVAQTNLMTASLVWGALMLFVVVGVVVMWQQTRQKRQQVAAVQQEVGYVQPKLVAKRQQILKALAENVDRLLRSTLQIRQLMTTQVATVHPQAAVEDVKKQMQEQEIRHLMVVDHHGKLLGLISDRDVKSKLGKTAGHIMSRELITVSPDVEVSPAVTMMLDNNISSLPVVEQGHLRGVVTSTDLMMAVQCCMHLLRKVTDPSAAAVLPSSGPAPDAKTVQGLRRTNSPPTVEA